MKKARNPSNQVVGGDCGGEPCWEGDEAFDGERARPIVRLSESSDRPTSSLTRSRVRCSSYSPLHDHGRLRVNMATGDSIRSRVTPYLIYLVFVTTLGPLQFGYHLVQVAEFQRRIS